MDWTAKYRPLAAQAEALKGESFILDGETIVLNEKGLSDFHALCSAITRRPQDLYLVVFDLLYLNGHDLRDTPLKDRREILQAMIRAGGASSSPKRCRAPAMRSTISPAKRTSKASSRNGWKASIAAARRRSGARSNASTRRSWTSSA
nr:hypothetical protein [Mesorhizobium sp. NFR06]